VFARCAWFGQDVLWLGPEPDDPFRELIDAVWRSFPQHPPYSGAPGAPVPHLTVGERKLGTVRALRDAATAVSAVLPARARVDRALLIAGTREPGSWRTVQEFALETTWTVGVAATPGPPMRRVGPLPVSARQRRACEIPDRGRVSDVSR